MCGRYTITVTIDELLLHYNIDGPPIPFHTPRYNVAPGQMTPAIINDGKQNRIGPLKWGLIPSWAKDEKMGFKMINARAETVMEKPAYRASFKSKRCIIPADGFYEWKVIGTAKQPMRIMLKSRNIFSMAGLYDTWISPDGQKISTCTIITTTPNSLMLDIHDRMPVILRPEDEALWLDRDNQDVDLLQSLLVPYDAAEMQAYPVSSQVGNVKNDSSELIEEISTN